MRKDFKIGLIVGLFILVGGVVWLSAGPTLSPDRKLALSHQKALQARQRPLEPESPPPAISPESQEPAVPTAESEVPSLPTTSPPNPAEAARPVKTTRFHVVQPGETLSQIASQYYGSSTQWQKIQTANPTLLKNPDKIRLGMKLIIPD